MSRSYKNTPWCGDRKGKDKKRMANKKVRSLLRNLDYELQNSDYKKAYSQYDICDFYSITSWEEYWQLCLKRYEWEKQHFPKVKIKEPIEEEEYRKWYKWYKMK